jgi:hypothetical protein
MAAESIKKSISYRTIGESSSKKESEEARVKLMKLHDENPDLSFEIRSYIANLDSTKKRKKCLRIF